MSMTFLIAGLKTLMFSKCDTSWAKMHQVGPEGGRFLLRVKWKINVSSYVLYAKYFPPLEHNPLRNNVSFTQTFTFEPLISDDQMSWECDRKVAENAGSKMHFWINGSKMHFWITKFERMKFASPIVRIKKKKTAIKLFTELLRYKHRIRIFFKFSQKLQVISSPNFKWKCEHTLSCL